MTVRQVFYQATFRDLVEKSEAGYSKVQTDLTLLRRDWGYLPYGWLADSTRGNASPTRSTASRKLSRSADLPQGPMGEADRYVEVWLEKQPSPASSTPSRDVRRAADGGARLRESVLPA